MPTAKFLASLHKVQVDKEGEAKLILTVPADALDKVLPLATLSGKLLSVEISLDPSN